LNFAQYGIEVNFTSSSVSVRSLAASGLSTFGTRLQTPTLIGCLLLKNLSAERCLCAADFSSAKRWDYLSLFDPVSSIWLFSSFAGRLGCRIIAAAAQRSAKPLTIAAFACAPV
jgi:hypothetical protein